MKPVVRTYRASFRTARRQTGPEESTAPVPCRAARLLALGHHLERLIATGRLKNHADASRRLGITEGRITQLMNLVLLSPEIQEKLATGELQVSERRVRRAAFAPCWTEQERRLS